MSTSLTVASDVAERVLAELRPHLKFGEVAGSIRRRKSSVKDIDIVVIPAVVLDGFLGDTRFAIEEVRDKALSLGRRSKAGDRLVEVEDVLGSGIKLELSIVTPPATWGALLSIRTGPAAFSQMLVTRIKGRGWKCEDGRVTNEVGMIVPTDSEEQFFAAARVEWKEPEHRNG